MAKYTVIRSCGHEETVALVGKTKDREWRLTNVEPYKLCYECYQEDLKKRREEAAQEATEAAKVNKLPELTGTEKQLPWAETIRIDLINRMEEIAHDKRYGADTAKVQPIIDYIKSCKTSTHWWIDHRFLVRDSHGIMQLLVDENEALKSEVIATPKEVIEEAEVEAVVRPENPLTETVAEIRVKENTVEVFFPEKRDDFREIIKSLHFEWDRKWKRELVSRNGSPDDRAAEVGHILLAKGFIIRIFGEAIRVRAIAGDYEQECTNWILAYTGEKYKGWFVIDWDRKDDFYDAARKLPGSKYDKPYVVVPPEHVQEVRVCRVSSH